MIEIIKWLMISIGDVKKWGKFYAPISVQFSMGRLQEKWKKL